MNSWHSIILLFSLESYIVHQLGAGQACSNWRVEFFQQIDVSPDFPPRMVRCCQLVGSVADHFGYSKGLPIHSTA